MANVVSTYNKSNLCTGGALYGKIVIIPFLPATIPAFPATISSFSSVFPALMPMAIFPLFAPPETVKMAYFVNKHEKYAFSDNFSLDLFG